MNKWTDDAIAMSWAIKNGIYIYPVPEKCTDWKTRSWCFIEISIRGTKHRTEEKFPQKDTLYDKIFEYYKYYYNKNK